MKITLKPNEVPFMVGDTVWVNQPCTANSQQSYYQAQIIQIFLAASFTSTIVIKERQAVHELEISSAVYDLKPGGHEEGSPRRTLEVQFFPPQKNLFATETELINYQRESNYSIRDRR